MLAAMDVASAFAWFAPSVRDIQRSSDRTTFTRCRVGGLGYCQQSGRNPASGDWILPAQMTGS